MRSLNKIIASFLLGIAIIPLGSWGTSQQMSIEELKTHLERQAARLAEHLRSQDRLNEPRPTPNETTSMAGVNAATAQHCLSEIQSGKICPFLSDDRHIDPKVIESRKSWRRGAAGAANAILGTSLGFGLVGFGLTFSDVAGPLSALLVGQAPIFGVISLALTFRSELSGEAQQRLKHELRDYFWMKLTEHYPGVPGHHRETWLQTRAEGLLIPKTLFESPEGFQATKLRFAQWIKGWAALNELTGMEERKVFAEVLLATLSKIESLSYPTKGAPQQQEAINSFIRLHRETIEFLRSTRALTSAGDIDPDLAGKLREGGFLPDLDTDPVIARLRPSHALGPPTVFRGSNTFNDLKGGLQSDSFTLSLLERLAEPLSDSSLAGLLAQRSANGGKAISLRITPSLEAGIDIHRVLALKIALGVFQAKESDNKAVVVTKRISVAAQGNHDGPTLTQVLLTQGDLKLKDALLDGISEALEHAGVFSVERALAMREPAHSRPGLDMFDPSTSAVLPEEPGDSDAARTLVDACQRLQ